MLVVLVRTVASIKKETPFLPPLPPPPDERIKQQNLYKIKKTYFILYERRNSRRNSRRIRLNRFK